jgi:hypothetical protein
LPKVIETPREIAPFRAPTSQSHPTGIWPVILDPH